MTLTIGVDVGGTKIAAGVVADDGALIARTVIPTEAEDATAILSGVVKVVRELRAAAPAAERVGVGVAALVDGATGMVLSGPNIAWRDLALGPMLADRLGLPVAVDNDANVAALAEATVGAGRRAGDQVMLTVGTGVGGGIVLGGGIYRGAHGLGAEVGHMVIAADGPLCPCGNRGCLEALASGTALGAAGRARAGDPDAAAIVAAAGDGGITGLAVGRAAQSGDPLARELVAGVGRWLGVGIASLVNALDPALVVVGGGVASLGDLLLDPARVSLAELLIGRPYRAAPPVVAARLGSDAGIVGAGLMAAAAA